VAVTVCFDSSFLMLSAKFHIDVVSEAGKLVEGKTHFVVPAAVLSELKGLAKSNGAPGRDARVALRLIEKRDIRTFDSKSGHGADAALVEASTLPNVIVATADLALRKKIRSVGKPVIFFREKAKLELEGIEASYW